MKKTIYTLMILAFSVCVAFGCDQKTVEWPDDGTSAGGGSECGAWYPGAPDPEAGTDDTGAVYDIEEGFFPCAVWETVKLDGEDIYFSVGEAYLNAKHGITDKKALVIPVSATS